MSEKEGKRLYFLEQLLRNVVKSMLFRFNLFLRQKTYYVQIYPELLRKF